MLQAFHAACDEGAGEVALALLTILVTHVKQPPCLPAGVERRVVVRLLGAHERLRNLPLTHPGDDRQPLRAH